MDIASNVIRHGASGALVVGPRDLEQAHRSEQLMPLPFSMSGKWRLPRPPLRWLKLPLEDLDKRDPEEQERNATEPQGSNFALG
jgi:hypothetical protein